MKLTARALYRFSELRILILDPENLRVGSAPLGTGEIPRLEDDLAAGNGVPASPAAISANQPVGATSIAELGEGSGGPGRPSWKT